MFKVKLYQSLIDFVYARLTTMQWLRWLNVRRKTYAGPTFNMAQCPACKEGSTCAHLSTDGDACCLKCGGEFKLGSSAAKVIFWE